ncbi:LOW QUALITY PROTEIN: X-box-binding protein 1 [Pangasianodon hypophthalmus]|uniref:LOW QUALITY PROTEIN: X-box-binding protein 1 n=1 Tax=Pangasianodon hypophthalmus TaxID=310915 RepID=UPI0023072EA3|nr:LOW QUALITY PROTEIN: X-box-binding protein 1 [Pangasianodon hypophthalmus]
MVVVAAGPGGAHKVLLISSSSSHSGDCNGAAPPLRKRQRLTHLSPEEKALRRKLKNRVAAQTARDRKKAKMGELEQQVLELEQENQKLHMENQMLRERTSDLMSENEELRQRLGLDTLVRKEKVQVLESGASDLVLLNGSSERSTQATCASAAGAGPAVIKAEEFALDPHSPDTADSESDLLLGILDIIEPELFLKEAQEPNPSQQLLLVGSASGSLPAPSPGAVGAAPVKLEALNELIQFDHIYTKPVEEEEKEGAYEVSIADEQDAIVFSSSSEDEEVEVEVETVSIKDEPEEVVIPVTDNESIGVDDFLSEASSSFGGYDKAAYLMSDTYSDSGYERSPSPFSDMSSPLCSDSSWEDMFANELFPQLISV